MSDRDRDLAVHHLSQGYVNGNLTAAALESRSERALRAQTAGEFCWSVRGLSGAVTELAVATSVAPLVRRHRASAADVIARAASWLAIAI